MVELVGEWAALLSLQTLGPIYLCVHEDAKLPYVTHIALSGVPATGNRSPVSATATVLLALFIVELELYDIERLLSPCTRLRTLHIAAQLDGPRDFRGYLTRIDAMFTLRDVGYYCRDITLRLRGADWGFLHNGRLSTPATLVPLYMQPILRTFSHLSLVNIDSAVMSKVHPSLAVPLPRYSWHSLAYETASRMALLFYGPSITRGKKPRGSHGSQVPRSAASICAPGEGGKPNGLPESAASICVPVKMSTSYTARWHAPRYTPRHGAERRPCESSTC